ncbi:hypothetical protein [Streptomyces sp. NBC_01276]
MTTPTALKPFAHHLLSEEAFARVVSTSYSATTTASRRHSPSTSSRRL